MDVQEYIFISHARLTYKVRFFQNKNETLYMNINNAKDQVETHVRNPQASLTLYIR
jgi:hypothetical protein